MWAAEAKTSTDIEHLNLKKGDVITITKGVDFKYAAWTNTGIYDLPEEYVDESSIKIISEK